MLLILNMQDKNKKASPLKFTMDQIEEFGTVNLNYSGLREIDFTEKEFMQIRCLYLKRNLLTSLSASIGRLQNLVELHVVSNYLEDLPDEIGDLSLLEVLDMGDNYLTKLPARLVELQSLQKLQISDNNFRDLPYEICQLQRLKVLEASRNKLTTIPMDISRCTSLEQLALDKNCLATIPSQLFRLKKLKELSLCGNRLTCIPHGVWRADSLETLNLDSNPLLAIPLSIQRMPTCSIGSYACLQPGRVELQQLIRDDVKNILPEGVIQTCVVGQNCVPCLEELAARHIGLVWHTEEHRQKLPLPKYWRERMIDPIGTCDRCEMEIFVSAFPIIAGKDFQSVYYYGLFCSVDCVMIYRSTTPLNIVYPEFEDG